MYLSSIVPRPVFCFRTCALYLASELTGSGAERSCALSNIAETIIAITFHSTDRTDLHRNRGKGLAIGCWSTVSLDRECKVSMLYMPYSDMASTSSAYALQTFCACVSCCVCMRSNFKICNLSLSPLAARAWSFPLSP